MISSRYTLQKYCGPTSRHTCPNCGQTKTFTRYIDLYTGQPIAPDVGRCDRETKCGYHLTPKQFFSDHPQPPEPAHKIRPVLVESPRQPIPCTLVTQSLTDHSQNRFAQYLAGIFEESMTADLINKYQIGSSSHWYGATVFWFIDYNGEVRAGQVKLFDRTGHSVRDHTTWVHSILQSTKSSYPWLQAYLANSNKVTCLFGEHLLRLYPTNIIGLVEAPATAIVASGYFPQYTWLATGSLSYLTRDRCSVLSGRKVILFPDLGGYVKWAERAKQMQDVADFMISDLLEKVGSQKDREHGLDLRDYITMFPPDRFRHRTEEIVTKSKSNTGKL